ncbi:MAG: tRNA preQ1(34) S-adenosylmethionine ribosyltransferase-isomerase QueA [Candidatus Sungbacteria bacterium]|nr:tRNA preQ1(34) S-adenosylmethionine ribosyltransferase-isomerase QueA [Candidatus Sungbacteria bacterium]
MIRAKNFDALLRRYDWRIPTRLIAHKPTSPRDAARLLVYNKKSKRVSYGTFAGLDNYIPSNTVVVFNQTKVIPARLELIKQDTGGRVRVLFVERKAGLICVLADRNVPMGTVLVAATSAKHCFVAVRRTNTKLFLRPLFPIATLSNLLQQHGTTPIPPYIRRNALPEKKLWAHYQSIFATTPGSIAAPTASLHFTKRLMQRLAKHGCSTAYVTLHVNLGTFAPLTLEHYAAGKLHKEHYRIDKKTAVMLNRAKQQGRPIIAVGTTVVRCLESAADRHRLLQSGTASTELFIQEGYKFKFVDGIITNFHVPRSSLLMLAAAFVSDNQLFSLYQKAIRKRFRFFSFGDGMLIL